MASPDLLAGLAALAAPLVGMLGLSGDPRHTRRVALAACAASVAASVAAGLAPAHGGTGAALQVVRVDGLAALTMAVFASAMLAAVALMPARDLTAPTARALLVRLAGTLLADAAATPMVLLAGWVPSALPFVAGPFASAATWRPRAALTASCLALGAAVALMAIDGGAWLRPFSELAGATPGGGLAFGCLMMAIVLRKGIFPAHAWVADAAAATPVAATLLFNGHLGALVLGRVVMPLFPGAVAGSLALISDLALFTAIYMAVRAVAEPEPRRILALVALSQAACILAGLESATAEGMVGALVHVVVVTASTTALTGILRSLEARGVVAIDRPFGAVVHDAPRLATGFVLSALALVGIPGTLGFASAELLIHGALAAHPLAGILLPAATALNAVCLLRLFSRLFLGAAGAQWPASRTRCPASVGP